MKVFILPSSRYWQKLLYLGEKSPGVARFFPPLSKFRIVSLNRIVKIASSLRFLQLFVTLFQCVSPFSCASLSAAKTVD